MTAASMFGSRCPLVSLCEGGIESRENSSINLNFHRATLPLDASTASLRELYAAELLAAPTNCNGVPDGDQNLVVASINHGNYGTW